MDTDLLNLRDGVSCTYNNDGFESDGSLLDELMTNSFEFVDVNEPVEFKEEFDRTFQEWEDHISFLQFRDDGRDHMAGDSELLCLTSPLIKKEVEDLDESFGESVNEESAENYFPPEIAVESPKLEVDHEPKEEFDLYKFSDKMPVLEAGDLTTLLEQFEASEAVICKPLSPTPVSLPSPRRLPNKQIQDMLPEELIGRIKEASSKRKKAISLVPAERLPPSKCGTRMCDAGATLSRNKLLKLVSGGATGGGESVQLDHDYCSNEKKIAKNFYGASKTEYVSDTTGSPEGKDKKDSGLESGEISDSSEASQEKKAAKDAKALKNPEEGIRGDIQPQKRRKLNLEEYRSRRRNQPVEKPKPKPRVDLNIPPETNVESTQDIPEVSKVDRVLINAEAQTPKPEKSPRRGRSRSRSFRKRRRRSSSSSSRSDSDRSSGRGRRGRKRSLWSRSRSRSSSRDSYSSSVSRSRSRSRDRWSRRSSSRSSFRSRRSVQIWSPPKAPKQEVEHKKQVVEERRVVYVGQIEEGTTKNQLRDRFSRFGPIVDISLHFRERGDNYGFVTFAYKEDAYRAVDNGNNDPAYGPRYDICFGGRRAFCRQRYADLDNTNFNLLNGRRLGNESFDALLREAKQSIRKRSVV